MSSIAVQGTLPPGTLIELDEGVTAMTYRLEPAGEQRGDVVLCHGTPWSAVVWAGVARSLASDYRVHLWDLPGYGASQVGTAVPLDLARQGARFARLLDLWSLDAPAVVAHDIGGAVALGAHLLHGRAFDRLFLWDVVTLEPWGSPFFRLVAAHREVFDALPSALHRALVREYIGGAGRLSPEWVALLSQPWLGPDGQESFYRQIAALRPEHTRPIVDRLAAVDCPVAIGWGNDDPWIPVQQAARLAQAVPAAATPLVLDGVGHLPQVEAPGAVAKAIAAWLDR